MSIVVFLGPSLAVDAAREVAGIDAEFRPPCAQGDVYRAALDRPWAVGIVDGYFERLPAVCHKEILWAMRSGVHVFGASSMGALRAAELDAFGMVGVGEIYRQFRDGELTDDDEVTVIHEDATAGYRPTSVALVDIRATLAAAVREGVVSSRTRDDLLASARRLFYPARTYRRLVDEARQTMSDTREVDAFEAWLPEGRVHQKRQDAISMLHAIQEWRARDNSPKQVDFRFQHTDVWEQIAQRSALDRDAAVSGLLSDDALLEELRLNPTVFTTTLEAAFARALALREASRRGVEVDVALFRETVGRFRRERDLPDKADVEAWMDSRQVDRRGFTTLMQDEARVHAVRALYSHETRRQVVDQLRLNGQYGLMAARAASKREILSSLGLDSPSLHGAPIGEPELLSWYFGERLGEAVPPDLDAAALRLGFVDRYALVTALLREYYFERNRPASREERKPG